jgi:hypothetical protein
MSSYTVNDIVSSTPSVEICSDTSKVRVIAFFFGATFEAFAVALLPLSFDVVETVDDTEDDCDVDVVMSLGALL